MKLFKLTAKSAKGKNRLSCINNLRPEWDGVWESIAIHQDQVFIQPRVHNPEIFSRWVELPNDPNFIVLPQSSDEIS